MLPKIPIGLRSLLKDFAKDVLREKPADINEFARNYFESMLNSSKDIEVNTYEPDGENVYVKAHISKKDEQILPFAFIETIIPRELIEVLKGFIKAVLREEPKSICKFGYEYFSKSGDSHDVNVQYTAYEEFLASKSGFAYPKCICGRKFGEIPLYRSSKDIVSREQNKWNTDRNGNIKLTPMEQQELIVNYKESRNKSGKSGIAYEVTYSKPQVQTEEGQRSKKSILSSKAQTECVSEGKDTGFEIVEAAKGKESALEIVEKSHTISQAISGVANKSSHDPAALQGVKLAQGQGAMKNLSAESNERLEWIPTDAISKVIKEVEDLSGKLVQEATDVSSDSNLATDETSYTEELNNNITKEKDFNPPNIEKNKAFDEEQAFELKTDQQTDESKSLTTKSMSDVGANKFDDSVIHQENKLIEHKGPSLSESIEHTKHELEEIKSTAEVTSADLQNPEQEEKAITEENISAGSIEEELTNTKSDSKEDFPQNDTKESMKLDLKDILDAEEELSTVEEEEEEQLVELDNPTAFVVTTKPEERHKNEEAPKSSLDSRSFVDANHHEVSGSEKQNEVDYNGDHEGSSLDSCSTVGVQDHEELESERQDQFEGAKLDSHSTVETYEHEKLESQKQDKVDSNKCEEGYSLDSRSITEAKDHERFESEKQDKVAENKDAERSSLEPQSSMEANDHEKFESKKQAKVDNNNCEEGSSLDSRSTVEARDHVGFESEQQDKIGEKNSIEKLSGSESIVTSNVEGPKNKINGAEEHQGLANIDGGGADSSHQNDTELNGKHATNTEVSTNTSTIERELESITNSSHEIDSEWKEEEPIVETGSSINTTSGGKDNLGETTASLNLNSTSKENSEDVENQDIDDQDVHIEKTDSVILNSTSEEQGDQKQEREESKSLELLGSVDSVAGTEGVKSDIMAEKNEQEAIVAENRPVEKLPASLEEPNNNTITDGKGKLNKSSSRGDLDSEMVPDLVNFALCEEEIQASIEPNSLELLAEDSSLVSTASEQSDSVITIIEKNNRKATNSSIDSEFDNKSDDVIIVSLREKRAIGSESLNPEISKASIDEAISVSQGPDSDEVIRGNLEETQAAKRDESIGLLATPDSIKSIDSSESKTTVASADEPNLEVKNSNMTSKAIADSEQSVPTELASQTEAESMKGLVTEIQPEKAASIEFKSEEAVPAESVSEKAIPTEFESEETVPAESVSEKVIPTEFELADAVQIEIESEQAVSTQLELEKALPIALESDNTIPTQSALIEAVTTKLEQPAELHSEDTVPTKSVSKKDIPADLESKKIIPAESALKETVPTEFELQAESPTQETVELESESEIAIPTEFESQGAITADFESVEAVQTDMKDAVPTELDWEKAVTTESDLDKSVPTEKDSEKESVSEQFTAAESESAQSVQTELESEKPVLKELESTKGVSTEEDSEKLDATEFESEKSVPTKLESPKAVSTESASKNAIPIELKNTGAIDGHQFPEHLMTATSAGTVTSERTLDETAAKNRDSFEGNVHRDLLLNAAVDAALDETNVIATEKSSELLMKEDNNMSVSAEYFESNIGTANTQSLKSDVKPNGHDAVVEKSRLLPKAESTASINSKVHSTKNNHDEIEVKPDGNNDSEENEATKDVSSVDLFPIGDSCDGPDSGVHAEAIKSTSGATMEKQEEIDERNEVNEKNTNHEKSPESSFKTDSTVSETLQGFSSKTITESKEILVQESASLGTQSATTTDDGMENKEGIGDKKLPRLHSSSVSIESAIAETLLRDMNTELVQSAEAEPTSPETGKLVELLVGEAINEAEDPKALTSTDSADPIYSRILTENSNTETDKNDDHQEGTSGVIVISPQKPEDLAMKSFDIIKIVAEHPYPTHEDLVESNRKIEAKPALDFKQIMDTETAEAKAISSEAIESPVTANPEEFAKDTADATDENDTNLEENSITTDRKASIAATDETANVLQNTAGNSNDENHSLEITAATSEESGSTLENKDEVSGTFVRADSTVSASSAGTTTTVIRIDLQEELTADESKSRTESEEKQTRFNDEPAGGLDKNALDSFDKTYSVKPSITKGPQVSLSTNYKILEGERGTKSAASSNNLEQTESPRREKLSKAASVGSAAATGVKNGLLHKTGSTPSLREQMNTGQIETVRKGEQLSEEKKYMVNVSASAPPESDENENGKVFNTVSLILEETGDFPSYESAPISQQNVSKDELKATASEKVPTLEEATAQIQTVEQNVEKVERNTEVGNDGDLESVIHQRNDPNVTIEKMQTKQAATRYPVQEPKMRKKSFEDLYIKPLKEFEEPNTGDMAPKCSDDNLQDANTSNNSSNAHHQPEETKDRKAANETNDVDEKTSIDAYTKYDFDKRMRNWESSHNSICLDADISENIRNKMLAYSVSEGDSDISEFDMKQGSNFDHFNISTTLERMQETSTDTESTIKRKIKSNVPTQNTASSDNISFDESHEKVAEDEAAKTIQLAYKKYLKRRKRHKRAEQFDSTLSYADSSHMSREYSLAARRMTLQRREAVRNDSNPEYENITETLLITASNKIDQGIASTHSQKGNRKMNAENPKWLALRQNSMPVQIVSEVFRMIPKHNRKRIKSAELKKQKGNFPKVVNRGFPQ